MTSFPTSVVTYATLVDFVDSPLAAHENSQGNELTAIETYLLGNVDTTVTTAAITLTKNKANNLTIAGLTANRNAVLPAPDIAGQYITVNILDGDDTYFVILIGDTGITINGGTAATEFFRLQTKGKSITFRATSTTNWESVAGVTDTFFQFPDFSSLVTQPFSANGATGMIFPFPTPMRLEKFIAGAFVATTNDGSNYWTIAALRHDASTIASVNTSAGSADAWKIYSTASMSIQNVQPSDLRAYVSITKTGAPGSVYIASSFIGRIS